LSPRPPREEGDPKPPTSVTTRGGSSSSTDHLYEVFQRLTSIESSLNFVVAAVDDSKTRIEALARDVSEAKTKFDTWKPIATWLVRGVWAVFVLFLTFSLSVLGMWMKHHFGW
jgi:hypothetical protein